MIRMTINVVTIYPNIGYIQYKNNPHRYLFYINVNNSPFLQRRDIWKCHKTTLLLLELRNVALYIIELDLTHDHHHFISPGVGTPSEKHL